MKFIPASLVLSVAGILLSSCGTGSGLDSSKPVQKVNPDKALEFFMEGVTQESMGQMKEALASYLNSLQQDSTTARAATTYFTLSRLLIKEKQPALALQASLKSVLLDSTQTDYHTQLAQAYTENTQFKEAARIYERLVRKDPDNNEFLYKLAIMYQLNKNPVKAIETFGLYLQRFGEDFNVRMQMLMIYDAQNERGKVISTLSEMIVSDPENDNLRRSLSKEYVQMQKLDSAELALKPILETKPNDVPTLLSLAEISFRAKDSLKTSGYLSRLIQSEAINDEELLDLGQAFVQMGKEDSLSLKFAVHLFSEMERVKPDDWRPKWFTGIDFLSRGKNREAVDRFLIVVEKKPDLVQAWQNLAIGYLQMSDYAGAGKWAEKGLETHPMDFQLNYFRGFSGIQLNQDTTAIRFLEKANRINPYSIEPLILLASAWEKMKNFAHSDSLFERVLKLDPENALVLNNFAYSLSERDIRLEESRKMSQLSLLKDPNNAAYLDTYGWILYKLKDYEGAAEYILKAIHTGEASAVVLEHLGDVYEAMGKPDEARIWWEKATAKDPTRDSPKQKLKALK